MFDKLGRKMITIHKCYELFLSPLMLSYHLLHLSKDVDEIEELTDGELDEVVPVLPDTNMFILI